MPSQHDNDNPEPVVDTYVIIEGLRNENKGLKSQLTKSQNRETKLQDCEAKANMLDDIMGLMGCECGWYTPETGYHTHPIPQG